MEKTDIEYLIRTINWMDDNMQLIDENTSSNVTLRNLVNNSISTLNEALEKLAIETAKNAPLTAINKSVNSEENTVCEFKEQCYFMTVYKKCNEKCKRQIKWFDCSIKEAPLESDILFQTKAGIIYAGIRFMPTKRSNKPVYQDFKKNKIRQNVVRWRFICD